LQTMFTIVIHSVT